MHWLSRLGLGNRDWVFSRTEVSFPGQKCLFPDGPGENPGSVFSRTGVYMKMNWNHTVMKSLINVVVVYAFTKVENVKRESRPGKDPSWHVCDLRPIVANTISRPIIGASSCVLLLFRLRWLLASFTYYAVWCDRAIWTNHPKQWFFKTIQYKTIQYNTIQYKYNTIR